MRRLRPKLTYANVMVTILAFIVLGASGAYAASQLGKNSVGPKQLKKNSVTTAKIKKNAVTGAKVKDQSLTGKDINLAQLGTVPSAQIANSIPSAEPTHLVGASGEPPFEGGSHNVGSLAPGVNLPPAGFYKDHEGIVHLEGFVKPGPSSTLFTLPPGYRLSPGQLRLYQPLDETMVFVSGVDAGVFHSGAVLGSGTASELVSLEGISFRPGA